jgi:hypothetical protein
MWFIQGPTVGTKTIQPRHPSNIRIQKTFCSALSVINGADKFSTQRDRDDSPGSHSPHTLVALTWDCTPVTLAWGGWSGSLAAFLLRRQWISVDAMGGRQG